MSYPNLKAEMARYNVSVTAVAEYLGVNVGTVSRWLNDDNASAPIFKAKKIRDKFFAGQSLEYLFDESPACVGTMAESAE